MSEKFTVEIISPAGSIMRSETTQVVLPSYEGEIGILKDHIPLITFLRPGIIKIDGSQKIFFVEDGTVEFANNSLLILTSTAKEVKDMDKNLLESIIDDAEKKIKSEDVTDKEKYLLSYKIDSLKNINR
tara:strand:+ start:712 stop:1098 length:387 start_codon:yes stop_codon:yes gene_type:complete